MRRISVVGTSGSGKSWLARKAAEILDVPYLELDGLNHQRDWTPLPDEEFTARVSAVAAGDGWVIDGNYSRARLVAWPRADTVIWLDLPRRTVMRQVVWRTLRRIITRAELWNGNRERWRNFFSWKPGVSVIAWAWRSYPGLRERYSAAAADPAFEHLRFIRLTSRADARRFLAGLAHAQTSGHPPDLRSPQPPR